MWCILRLIQFLNVVVLIIVLVMITNGMGLPVSEITFDDFVLLRKLLIVAEVFYTWILCGTKISVLLMYARIFGLADHFVRASFT